MLRLGFAVIAVAAASRGAIAVEVATPPIEMGVRHEVRASLSVDKDAAGVKSAGTPVAAEVRVTFQISDHAPDADFFGVEVGDFQLTQASLSAPQQLIWADRSCHHDRGFPKVSIPKIEGSLTIDGSRTTVAAAPRKIGKHLEADEITVRRLFAYVRQGATNVFAMRATTKGTHLMVDFEIVTAPCALGSRP